MVFPQVYNSCDTPATRSLLLMLRRVFFKFRILHHIQPSRPSIFLLSLTLLPVRPPHSSELHMAGSIRDDVHGFDGVILATLPPTGFGQLRPATRTLTIFLGVWAFRDSRIFSQIVEITMGQSGMLRDDSMREPTNRRNNGIMCVAFFAHGILACQRNPQYPWEAQSFRGSCTQSWISIFWRQGGSRRAGVGVIVRHDVLVRFSCRRTMGRHRSR